MKPAAGNGCFQFSASKTRIAKDPATGNQHFGVAKTFYGEAIVGRSLSDFFEIPNSDSMPVILTFSS